ncbi:hypothetical protein TSACC_3683 [Terrimicrobium sacchariphilum]|uniref:Bbp19-like phage domain-containing protein n=1 Tax=Terrimicrobium sacchariphilum TaxID=690879 RepID=A0A146GER7_TERSA|nr:hypothetical protein [Terrimicrobium sacchariphilum]GAT35612.1 hypothetical protein TSACC_3683 [Terrimicrobium sacchariphilum]
MSEAAKQRGIERARERQRLVNAARRVLESEDGRVLMAHLEETFRVNERVFTPVRSGADVYAYDPITAALADGARAVVLHLKGLSAATVKGDANIEEPTITVTKP